MSDTPNRKPLNPSRCAYLLDAFVDSIVSLSPSQMKTSFKALRECHKNKEINADYSEKPTYVQNNRKRPTNDEMLKMEYEKYIAANPSMDPKNKENKENIDSKEIIQ
ncbi:hypothetical protein WA158_003764 [Blastocystis sp. Blastoise]